MNVSDSSEMYSHAPDISHLNALNISHPHAFNISHPHALNISHPHALNISHNETDIYDTKVIGILTVYIVPSIFAVILTVGVIGNILVITVVSTNQQMRNTTNLLILNLAVADLIFLTICLPFTACDYSLSMWPFGLIMCRTVQYIIYVTAYVSIYTLVLMAGDRLLAVVFPVSSITVRTINNVNVLILATWSVTTVTVSPVWFTHSLLHNETRCSFDNVNYSYAGFHLSFFTTSFAIPLILISIMYIFMLRGLWSSVVGRVSKEGLKAKRRVTRLVMAVIVIFVVCWTPIQIVLLLQAVSPKSWSWSSNNVAVQVISQVMAYTNSCLNPIVYAMMSANFRNGFFQLIPTRFLGSSSRPRGPLHYEMTTRRARRRPRAKTRDVVQSVATVEGQADKKDKNEMNDQDEQDNNHLNVDTDGDDVSLFTCQMPNKS